MVGRVLIVALLFIAARASAGAQVDTTAAPSDSARHTRSGLLVGMSLGLPGARGEAEPALFTVGVHFTQLYPGRPGVDFAIGTMPRLWGEGVAVIGTRLGVAVPLSLGPDLDLIPSGGVSLIAAANEGFGAAIGGFNAGLAGIVWNGSIGMRTGVTWHAFQDVRSTIWLAELGIVVAP